MNDVSTGGDITFSERDKAIIACAASPQSRSRHKIIQIVFHILSALFIAQLLGRSFLHIKNTLLFNFTGFFFFMFMYLLSLSERKQVIRKFAQGAHIDANILAHYTEGCRKNRRLMTIIFVVIFSSIAVLVALITFSS